MNDIKAVKTLENLSNNLTQFRGLSYDSGTAWCIRNDLDLAIAAFKKQIPKQCNTETINRGIDISGEYDINSNYLCPICKTVVGDYESEEHFYNYCPECGQKLDWSEENE